MPMRKYLLLFGRARGRRGESSPCMEAIPSPSPGTGAIPTPCRSANRNMVRGVCSMRKASRFSLVK